jgi:hypothetical protein
VLHLIENDSRVHGLGAGFVSPEETVITPALLRITHDFVGRIDLSDFGLGVCAVGVAIGMVLKNELAVRLLDLLVRRLS